MIADPTFSSPWDLGLIMLAPGLLAIIVGMSLRWFKRSRLQDVSGRKTTAMTRIGPTQPPFESVGGSVGVDCDPSHSSLQTKVVT